MGTNYHITNPIDGEEIHVGKSSAGWRFHYHGTTVGEVEIRSRSDWERVIVTLGVDVVDEYGRREAPAEFFAWADATEALLSHYEWTVANATEGDDYGISRSLLASGECWRDDAGWDFMSRAFS